MTATHQASPGLAVRVAGCPVVIPTTLLRAVTPVPPLSRVPFAAPWMRGVGEIAPRVLAAVDLACLLGAPPIDVTERARALVAQTRDIEIALLVEAVSGMAPLAPAAAARHAAPGPAGIEPFTAAVLEVRGAHWPVLDLTRLLADPRLRAPCEWDSHPWLSESPPAAGGGQAP